MDITTSNSKDQGEKIILDACNLLGISINYTKQQLKIAFGEVEFEYRDNKGDKKFKDIKIAYRLLFAKITEKEKILKNEESSEKLDIDQLADKYLENNDILLVAPESIYYYYNNVWTKTKASFLEKRSRTTDLKSETTIKRRRETIDNALSKRIFDEINWNKGISQNEIPFQNGVFDIKSKNIRNHNKEDYLNYKIEFNYNKNAICPRWTQCLDEWFGDNENKKMLLQEFFGYTLASHCKWKKCLWLLGANDTGKSKVLEVLGRIIGEKNYSTVSMDSMDDPRKISEIYGKRANLVFDEKTSCLLAEGGFKKLVCGEPLSIDVKYEANSSYRPKLKHAAAMNDLPTMLDSTDAIITRILLIEFNNKIQSFDDDLMDKLELEIEGIIKWAVDGLIRRTETKKWTEVIESVELLKTYKIEQSPLLDFIESSGYIEKDPKGSIKCSEFIELFNNYRNGHNMTSTKIGIRMKKLGYKSKNLGNYYVYTNIKKSEKISINNENLISKKSNEIEWTTKN